MMTAVGARITDVIVWVGTVIDALLSTDGQLAELLPLFAITVAISGIMLAIKIIRGFVWGN